MTAPLGQVFDETVVNLLSKVATDDPGGRVKGVEFDVRPETTLMTANDTDTTFKTPDGRSNKDGRDAFVGALLGQLAARSDRWGALFNYPRTLLVGPKAAFKCKLAPTLMAPRAGAWGDTAQVKSRKTVQRHIRDFDQVVWVNHCGDDTGMGWVMPPTIEIGVMRLRQENRAETAIAYETAWVRVVDSTSDETNAYPPMDGKKPAEAEALANLLDRDGGYTLVEPRSSTSRDRASNELGNAGSAIGYVSMAAVILEHIMRDRTTPLSDLVSKNVTAAAAKTMVQAVLSGQVPYAASDLNPNTRQPAVMPGRATPAKIVNVMMHVTGKDALKSAVNVSGRQADPRGDQLARAANPYARMAASRDADDAAESSSNPYARLAGTTATASRPSGQDQAGEFAMTRTTTATGADAYEFAAQGDDVSPWSLSPPGSDGEDE